MVFRGRRLVASSIYNWFAKDFGGPDKVLDHLRQYAAEALRQRLGAARPITHWMYDWAINTPPARDLNGSTAVAAANSAEPARGR